MAQHLQDTDSGEVRMHYVHSSLCVMYDGKILGMPWRDRLSPFANGFPWRLLVCNSTLTCSLPVAATCKAMYTNPPHSVTNAHGQARSLPSIFLSQSKNTGHMLILECITRAGQACASAKGSSDIAGGQGGCAHWRGRSRRGNVPADPRAGNLDERTWAGSCGQRWV